MATSASTTDYSAIPLRRGRSGARRIARHDVEARSALALGGDAAGAEALAEPSTRAHRAGPPAEIRAELALQHGDAAKALDSLQAAAPYEMAQPNSNILILFPVYVRGRAYLHTATEFQKIVDHPSLMVNSPVGALAKLGLARAYALPARTKAAPPTFCLGLWKNADPNVPILQS